MSEILAFDTHPSNAELIAAAAQLGYLRKEWLTLDMTYGRGTFWNCWRPDRLVTNDLGKGTPEIRFDMHHSPFPARSFDVVVIDCPYKLNGTPDHQVDERYGIEEVRTRDERHDLMYAALEEGCRIARQFVLFKCQDQVNSGRVWWQRRMFAEFAEGHDFTHKDELSKLGHRPNRPEQEHARRNCSTLLVLKAPKPVKKSRQGSLL